MPHMTTEDFALPSKAKGLGDMDRCDRCGSQYAYVGRELACGVCGHPAPPDHPEQMKLKADWAAHDARNKAEAAKQNKIAQEASTNPYSHTPALAAQEEAFAAIQRQLQAHEKRIASLEAALAKRK